MNRPPPVLFHVVAMSFERIKPENLDKLFSNFAKLEEHAKINPSGTGLGLSICKQMIEQMRGSVHVESVVDKGTKFSFDIRTKGRRVQSAPHLSMNIVQ